MEIVKLLDPCHIVAAKAVLSTEAWVDAVEFTMHNSTQHPVRLEFSSQGQEPKIIVLQPNETITAPFFVNQNLDFSVKMEFQDEANFWPVYQNLKLPSNQKEVRFTIGEVSDRSGSEFWPPVEWVEPILILQD
ncbi:MAG: hypothetical protein V4487_00900 [Chlamydiota bacterium]